MNDILRDVVLTLRDISVARDGRDMLSNVDLVVRGGELSCVVGPNGAGKSTLLSVIAGALQPSLGEVRASDRPLFELSPRERARFVSMLRQVEEGDLEFTVRDMVGFGRFPHQDARGRDADGDGDEIIFGAMRDANIEAFRDRPVRELSGGEQRRAHLARVLAQKTRLVLLDEPTASLDVREQRGIEAIVKRAVRGGVAAVIVTHDVAGAMATADRLVVLHEGRVAYDGPPQTLDASVLEHTFGVPFVPAEMAGRRVLTESRG